MNYTDSGFKSMNFSKIDQVTSLHKNNEVQYLCFRLEKDADLYAVNVFKIQEIIKYDRTPTLIEHNDDALLEGLITVRNITIPLIDMRKWFHYDSFTHSNEHLSQYAIAPEDSQIMICDFSGVTIGVRIYEADRILTKNWDDVFPAINVNKDIKKNKINNNTRYIDGSLVQIVDIEQMLVDLFPIDEEELTRGLENVKHVIPRKWVLIAEDSVVATRILEAIMNKLKVNYRIFENGKKLLDFLAENDTLIGQIGLIITDLEMPIASGFEVIKQIRANSLYDKIYIAANSSMSGDSNREMAISLGANKFIPKTSASDIAQLIFENCN